MGRTEKREKTAEAVANAVSEELARMYLLDMARKIFYPALHLYTNIFIARFVDPPNDQNLHMYVHNSLPPLSPGPLFLEQASIMYLYWLAIYHTQVSLPYAKQQWKKNFFPRRFAPSHIKNGPYSFLRKKVSIH